MFPKEPHGQALSDVDLSQWQGSMDDKNLYSKVANDYDPYYCKLLLLINKLKSYNWSCTALYESGHIQLRNGLEGNHNIAAVDQEEKTYQSESEENDVLEVTQSCDCPCDHHDGLQIPDSQKEEDKQYNSDSCPTWPFPTAESQISLSHSRPSIYPEEESCLMKKMYYDSIHWTNLDGYRILFGNLYKKQMLDPHTYRGDKPPVSTLNDVDRSFSYLKRPNNLRSFASTDDGTSLNETTVGLSSGYYTGTRSDYSESSLKAKIVGAGSSHFKRANLAGVYSETDKKLCNKVDHDQKLGLNLSKIGDDLDAQSKYGNYTTTQSKHSYHDRHTNSLLPTTEQKHQYVKNQPTVAAIETAVTKVVPTTNKTTGYNKSTYSVLVGDNIKIYNTNPFASLPHHNKFMVKERLKETNRIRLVLKCSATQSDNKFVKKPWPSEFSPEDDIEKDGAAAGDGCGEVMHFRENAKRSGYVIYTCDKNFHGNKKYPLPTGKAADSRIGKGGNGFVFTIYHEKRVYAVKKTVYRPNEVNVHSALKHKNILPLLAVLIGEKHERHSGRFYCYHFMPKMDYDLRQILSVKEIGCLKHYYSNCSKDLEKWQTGFTNIKFILQEILEALEYLHGNGYVHRDVKASNIMIKMACQCRPLSCKCSSKFLVKLGDFDSAGTVPGLGITEPTDQIIKFASILPLGTPGYRAPEVSMQITLSGPYETLYTTAVDMWSFGCLCLNICIGKTAALKQREEASLLLSKNHPCAKELWEKTTKIKELESSSPFSTEREFTNFIRCCLQVDGAKRPSAKDAIKIFMKLKNV